jgi:DNA (cytosine-5)-methyltransferase 1
MILDLFAGPGGWDEGLRRNGRTDVIGWEVDQLACETARLNGHVREHADVYGARPQAVAARFPVEGVIGSPPCGGLSGSGLKIGRNDLSRVSELLAELDFWARQDLTDDPRADHLMHWEDLRSPLLAEPLRWLMLTGARWLILEQVEAAIPVWADYADILEARGWWVDYGVLNAADFGVPQDRPRAVLVAHHYEHVSLPTPTHAGRWAPASTVLGDGVRFGFQRLNDRPDGGKYRARDLRTSDQVAFTVTEKARSWSVIDSAGLTRQLTISEAGELQSFPTDYQWAGKRSAQFLQAANAVPPALAEAVTKVVLGADRGAFAPTEVTA